MKTRRFLIAVGVAVLVIAGYNGLVARLAARSQRQQALAATLHAPANTAVRASAAITYPTVVITSDTPTIEASVVAIVKMAYQFIQAGSMRLTHCGKIICHKI